jgi:hypothetical protein
MEYGAVSDTDDAIFVCTVCSPLRNCELFYVFIESIGISVVQVSHRSAYGTNIHLYIYIYMYTPWLDSASEMYRPSDRLLFAKLVPTFANRECHMISVTDPYDRILDFLDRSHYLFFQVGSQLCSRG